MAALPLVETAHASSFACPKLPNPMSALVTRSLATSKTLLLSLGAGAAGNLDPHKSHMGKAPSQLMLLSVPHGAALLRRSPCSNSTNKYR